ncbi:MAG: hypothetical protein JW934_16705 [Anaerolineae bacterium]|nr:hypothetical protein [Anaerolineae bacterium]
MSKHHDMTTPAMTRATVRVPEATLAQIDRWADALGVRRSHFLGIALVAGARSIIRSCAPELLSCSPEISVPPLDTAQDDPIGEETDPDPV